MLNITIFIILYIRIYIYILYILDSIKYMCMSLTLHRVANCSRLTCDMGNRESYATRAKVNDESRGSVLYASLALIL